MGNQEIYPCPIQILRQHYYHLDSTSTNILEKDDFDLSLVAAILMGVETFPKCLVEYWRDAI
jgi:hypothetical protein